MPAEYLDYPATILWPNRLRVARRVPSLDAFAPESYRARLGQDFGVNEY